MNAHVKACCSHQFQGDGMYLLYSRGKQFRALCEYQSLAGTIDLLEPQSRRWLCSIDPRTFDFLAVGRLVDGAMFGL